MRWLRPYARGELIGPVRNVIVVVPPVRSFRLFSRNKKNRILLTMPGGKRLFYSMYRVGRRCLYTVPRSYRTYPVSLLFIYLFFTITENGISYDRPRGDVPFTREHVSCAPDRWLRSADVLTSFDLRPRARVRLRSYAVEGPRLKISNSSLFGFYKKNKNSRNG